MKEGHRVPLFISIFFLSREFCPTEWNDLVEDAEIDFGIDQLFFQVGKVLVQICRILKPTGVQLEFCWRGGASREAGGAFFIHRNHDNAQHRGQLSEL